MTGTVENSIIIAKTSKPQFKKSLFGIFNYGGEININDKFGVRFSPVGKGKKFLHIKIIVYGEKPSYKLNKFVKIKKVKEKRKKKKPKEIDLEVAKEMDLFDEV